MDNETNRVIAEWLGKCWHRDFTERFYCKVCPPYEADSEWRPDPFYTTSLDALRPVELKVIEEQGWRVYHKALLANIPASASLLEAVIVLPANIRAAAVRRLIEESK